MSNGRGKGEAQRSRVLTVSLYVEDVERLDVLAKTLKARGLTKANRSALIRYGISLIDPSVVPPGLGEGVES